MRSAARVEAFLEMMSAERGASDNTLQSYRRDLEDAAERLPVGIAEAGAAELRVYLADIAGRGFASTLAGAQALGAAAVLQVPLRRRAAPRRPDRHARQPAQGPLAAEDHERGRDRPAARPRRRGSRTRRRRRRRAMPRGACMRWSSCSMRPACASPNWSSLPVTVALRDDRFFVVRGKGDKERMVPLSEKAREAMRAWLVERNRDPRHADSSWLFPAASESGYLPRQVFARDLKALGRACRHRGGEDLAARASPRLRQPSPAERRRPARRAAIARPRRHLDDADLHACAGGTAGAAGQRSSPACRLGPVSLCESGCFHAGAAVFEVAGQPFFRLRRSGPITNVQLPRFRKARCKTSKARSSN